MVATRPDRIYRNPGTDRRFAAAVAASVRGSEEPAALQAVLRLTYPRAIVRAGDLSGTTTVWYVYRDGSWVDDGR